MHSPKVSVVVPTYNRPDLLQDALKGLAVQEGIDFDVVVINDAGVDVTDVVGRFKGFFPVKYVNLKENGRLPHARNVGITNSEGEYIAYLDDDDVFLPGHLANLVQALDTRPEVGLVYSDAILEKQEVVGGEYVTVAERVLAQDYDRSIMLHDSFICPSAVMHRRECVERVGGFDEAMRWCYEDWDFWLKVNNVYQIERVPGASVRIRLRDNGSNMSSTVNEHRRDAATALRDRYAAAEIEPKTFWEVADTLNELAAR